MHTSANTASNECTEYVGHVFAVISFCESQVFSKIEICGRRCTDDWYVVYSRYELVALEVHLLIYNAVPVISKLSPWFVEKTRELLRQKIVATLIWVCDFWLNGCRHRLINIKSIGCRHRLNNIKSMGSQAYPWACIYFENIYMYLSFLMDWWEKIFTKTNIVWSTLIFGKNQYNNSLYQSR